MCAPIGRTLATDDTFCIGMNRGLVHSLNVNGDQRGLSKDESGRYGRASMYHNDVPRDHLNRASGKVIPWESRPTREIGKSGRRAKGGRRNTSELPGLQGRTMRKSLLIPNAMMCPLWKAVCSETSLHSLGRGG